VNAIFFPGEPLEEFPFVRTLVSNWVANLATAGFKGAWWIKDAFELVIRTTTDIAYGDDPLVAFGTNFLSLAVSETLQFLGKKLMKKFLGKFIPCGGCFVPGTVVQLSNRPAFAAVDSVQHDLERESDESVTIGAAIENVPLGSRVTAQNPRPEQYDFAFGEVDQSSWSQINLRLQRDDGALVEMELLRPSEWIKDLGLKVGAQINLSLHDIVLRGLATITAIEPCPPILEGPGSVVIGRFVTRQAQNLIEVELANGTSFVGTKTHPVWLPDERSWVALSDLQ
jgi:hypothetical protein